jgi:hypothetical protein
MLWITVSWKGLPGTNTLAYYLIMLPNDTTQTYMNINQAQTLWLIWPRRQGCRYAECRSAIERVGYVTFFIVIYREIFYFLRKVHHPQNGITNPKYKLLHFLTTKMKFCKEKKALAFNWDRCCHLVLCSRLILFHYFWS